MAETPNIDLPLPDVTQTVAEEFYVLRDQTLPKLDEELHELELLVAGKADADHDHTIGEIPGLTAILEGKMAANKTFAMSDLTDVVGLDASPDGYIPVKVGDQVVFQSALSALGDHNHSIEEVTGLQTVLDGLDSAIETVVTNLGSIASADVTVGPVSTPPSGGVDGDLWLQV